MCCKALASSLGLAEEFFPEALDEDGHLFVGDVEGVDGHDVIGYEGPLEEDGRVCPFQSGHEVILGGAVPA